MARSTKLPALLLWAAVAAFASLPALLLADPLNITVQVTNPDDPGGGDDGGGGSSGGGSSGGGSPVPVDGPQQPRPELPVPTTVTFTGVSYPGGRVTVLRDGQAAGSTVAGPDARFQFSLVGLAGGSYIFSLYGEDTDGRRSSLLTFPLEVEEGTITTVGGIFIASTIDLDRDEVRRGETIKVFGQSAPNAAVTIAIHSEVELLATATSDFAGAYERSVDTAPLEVGDHSAKARAEAGEGSSPYGQSVGFRVGTRNVGRTNVCANRADFTGECRVNLVDFSILAYWYRRANPPAPLDLKLDGRIDIVDFSILAYAWTG